MSDVFISYSRKDGPVVRELKARLEARGRNVWVDLEDIPPTAEWLAEIKSAIEAAHGIVYIISPHSLASDVCREELRHAEMHGKRVIPVLAADVERGNVPQSLSVLNWIVARQPDEMERAVEHVIAALDTDLDWVKAHTRQLIRANEWEHRHRDKSLLLRGRDLSAAQAWLQSAVAKEPRPTESQSRFIQASAVAARQRRRLTAGAIGVALLIAGSLSAMVVTRANQRDRARQAAVAESLRADQERRVKRAEAAAKLAIRSRRAFGDSVVPLALTAYRITEPDPPIHDAKQALIDALFRHRDYPFTGIQAFHPRIGLSRGGGAWPISFGPTREGENWLFGRVSHNAVRGWPICFERPPVCGGEAAVQPISGAPGWSEIRNSAVFSRNGRWFATTSDSGRAATVWEITYAGSSGPAFQLRHRMRTSGRDAQVLAIGNEGRWLVIQPYRAQQIELWDLSSTPPVRAHELGVAQDLTEVSAADISVEARWLAVAAGRVGTRGAVTVWDLDALEWGPAFELPGSKEIRSGALSFSPDGRWLAGSMQLWKFAEIRAGGDRHPIGLPTQEPETVAFSPDSRWLVTGGGARGNDKISTYLWDLRATEPGREYLVLPHQFPSGDPMSHRVQGSAFSRDGRWLATSTTGSAPDYPRPPNVFLWPLRTDDWVALACEVGGPLSEHQWAEHVQDEPYRALCSGRPN